MASSAIIGQAPGARDLYLSGERTVKSLETTDWLSH